MGYPTYDICDLLDSIGDRIHANKVTHGWHVTTMKDWGTPDAILSPLMLITTEVAEAAEAVRLNDIENFKEELADVMIRVIGLSHGLGFNIGEAIMKKMEYNKSRPVKHGGKRI